jgi:hypothetical protein
MNTTLRTSVHTCIVTREAVEHMLAESATGQVEAAMMPLPDMRDLVAVKTLIPPSTVEGGNIRAVFELTERVDA